MNRFSVLFLLLLLPHPVYGAFGRRGAPTTPLEEVTVVPEGWSWSSTGMQGLDHSAPDKKSSAKKVLQVKRRKIRDPARLEHHPYASGAFTLKPQLEADEN